MKSVLQKAGKTILAVSAFAALLASQAMATYRIPSDILLMPSAPTKPGSVVPQTVIANDTQWAYLISVPSTYDSTASKLWPCIIYMPTAECNWNPCCAAQESTIVSTHCWNGGLSEIVYQTPDLATSFSTRFVVITPYVDQTMIGENQGGKPARLAGFINYMKRHIKIDSTQISFMGACWGSSVLWNLARFYPTLPACMVLMDGNDNWASTYYDTNVCNLKDIPIKLLAASPGSEQDSINMTAAHNAIQACGTNKETITYYKCGVHEMWSGPLSCGGVGADTIKSIFDWMLTNKLSTSVEAPMVKDVQASKASVNTLNSLSATDRIEVIGLNGQILLRSSGSALSQLRSNLGQGVHLIRVTHADQSTGLITFTNW